MFDFKRLKMIPNSMNGFRSPPSKEQISELEKYIGHNIPDSFKEILLKYNDSSPATIHFSYVDTDTGATVDKKLNQFFFLDSNKEHPTNIWFQIKHFSHYLGPDSLPFADDMGQQVYYFKWVDEKPQVWLLSHLDKYMPESYFIMNSFDDLLESLHDAE